MTPTSRSKRSAGRLALLALAALPLALTGCDASGDGDLFLLPSYSPSQLFTFPLDSLVTLPPQDFEITFTFQGGQVVPFEEFEVAAASPLGITSFVETQGYDPDQIREVRLAGPIELRLQQPAGANLGFLEYAALALAATGHSDFELTERTAIEPGATVATLGVSGPIEPGGSPIPAAYAREGSLHGLLLLGVEEALPPSTYTLRVSMPLRVAVNVAPPPAARARFVTGDFDVRAFLQSQGFEIGDAEQATVREVTITPEQTNADEFALRVQRAEVRFRAAGEASDEVMLGTVSTYGEPVELSRDVTALVRRTGRVQLVIDLILNSGGALEQGALSFTAGAEIHVEVPQPTTSGG